MSDRTPTLSDVVLGALDKRLADVHTAIPGRVERFDSSTGLADVQPLVQGYFSDESGSSQAENLPVVTNVPVYCPGGGGYRLTFPVAAGDLCTLLFSEASVDLWVASDGQAIDPKDARRFDLSDGIVALVGLKTSKNSWTIPTDGATFGKEGGLQFKAKGSTLELGGADAAVGKGESVNSAINTFATALATAATSAASLSTVALAFAAFSTSITTAATALSSSLAAALSTTVKVKG